MAGELDWARDIVLTELRRAYPEGFEKDDLQELGIGPGDLRVVIQQLVETGEVAETEGGYRFVEVEDRAGVFVAGEGLPAAEMEGYPDDRPPLGQSRDPDEEPAEEPEAVTEASGAHYRAGLLLHVTFVPESQDGDEGAVREAEELRIAAMNGILAAWPDLAVSSVVASLEAFDTPRRVL